MKRAGSTATAVVIIAAAIFAAGAIGPWRTAGSGGDPAGAAGSATQTSALAARPAFTSGGTLDAQIASLQEQLRIRPDDIDALASLGFAYVQQARVTADAMWYAKAEGAVARAQALDARSEHLDTLIAAGALALARHDFDDALRLGERAREINPDNATARGIIGDALIELGRYEEAFDSFQAMIDLRPDLASWSRVSYARELTGDVPGAIGAMREAERLAPTMPDAARAAFQVGELQWRSGDEQGAAASYRRALALDETFVGARAGLANVAWARGDTRDAIRRYEAVVAAQPLPEYVLALGELYDSVGQSEDAEAQWAVVRATQQLAAANGVNVDLELALFDADHGEPRAAVAAALAEWERRESIHVADAAAWSLRRAGEPRRAWRYAEEAMRLGTRDASILFHAGMIRLDLGDREGGERFIRRALSINPHFSVRYGPVAEQIVGR